MFITIGLICLATIFLVLLYHLAFRIKVFASFQVKKLKIPAGTILYTPYYGNYHKLMPSINQTKRDFYSYFDWKRTPSKNVKFFGIYYDDPKLLKDPNQGRAILGAIFLDSDQDRHAPFNAQEFLHAFKGKTFSYKSFHFDNLDVFGAIFPLYGFLNIVSALVRGYPAIKKYGLANDLIKGSKPCAVEIYDYPGKQLTVCFPYGVSMESLLAICDSPTSLYKESFKEK